MYTRTPARLPAGRSAVAAVLREAEDRPRYSTIDETDVRPGNPNGTLAYPRLGVD